MICSLIKMCFHRELERCDLKMTPGERYKKEMKFVQKKISQARKKNRKKWIRDQKLNQKLNQRNKMKWNEYPKTNRKKMNHGCNGSNGNKGKYPRTEVRVKCNDVTIHVIQSLTIEGYEIFFDWNREKYIIMV